VINVTNVEFIFAEFNILCQYAFRHILSLGSCKQLAYLNVPIFS